MSDLPERLRNERIASEMTGVDGELFSEAADEIERLQWERSRLNEALDVIGKRINDIHKLMGLDRP